MTTGITTLRDALTQEKPRIHRYATNTNTYRNDDAWPELNGHMKLWVDFKIGALNKQYGSILDKEFPEGVAVPQAFDQLKNLAIKEVKDIKRIIAWNVSILEPALAFGQSELQHQGPRLVHDHVKPQIPGPSSQARVDHLIKVVDAPPRTLVVGLGTTSAKFEGGGLLSAISQNIASRHENLMRQLAHACKLANARYGYLQTDGELVACRFSCTGTVWEAEFMPIPMELHGDNAMTTELAVWWMAMLALSDISDSAIEANNDHQADVAYPDVNPGLPSGPNMGSYLSNASFTSAPDMGSQDNNAGVGGIPNVASCNASFPSGTNTGPAENSIEFASDVQLDDVFCLEEMEIDEFQGCSFQQSSSN
ncbi:unnamed protein product [Clonostachys solani]|uniref:Uncharacterized protein n=1 Tax=Clonostachys solani TaxID=160281 RepID=A0A9N9ZP70_9HYPO|nr:unnamed protein product [Clonostachys solani]